MVDFTRLFVVRVGSVPLEIWNLSIGRILSEERGENLPREICQYTWPEDSVGSWELEESHPARCPR